MEEKNYQKEGGVFEYPNLIPVKFFVNFDPPQLGLLYKRDKLEKKKHMFLIQLNALILIADPEQITHVLFEKYPAFMNEKTVSPSQIYNLVSKILEYIQNMLMQYGDNDDISNDQIQHDLDQINLVNANRLTP